MKILIAVSLLAVASALPPFREFNPRDREAPNYHEFLKHSWKSEPSLEGSRDLNSHNLHQKRVENFKHIHEHQNDALPLLHAESLSHNQNHQVRNNKKEESLEDIINSIIHLIINKGDNDGGKETKKHELERPAEVRSSFAHFGPRPQYKPFYRAPETLKHIPEVQHDVLAALLTKKLAHDHDELLINDALLQLKEERSLADIISAIIDHIINGKGDNEDPSGESEEEEPSSENSTEEDHNVSHNHPQQQEHIDSAVPEQIQNEGEVVPDHNVNHNRPQQQEQVDSAVPEQIQNEGEVAPNHNVNNDHPQQQEQINPAVPEQTQNIPSADDEVYPNTDAQLQQKE